MAVSNVLDDSGAHKALLEESRCSISTSPPAAEIHRRKTEFTWVVQRLGTEQKTRQSDPSMFGERRSAGSHLEVLSRSKLSVGHVCQ